MIVLMLTLMTLYVMVVLIMEIGKKNDYENVDKEDEERMGHLPHWFDVGKEKINIKDDSIILCPAKQRNNNLSLLPC